MKLCIIGDPHFRHQLPYSTALPDGRASEWSAVKDKLIELASGCDEVILMGDNLNSKHNHSSVNSEFVEFLQRFGNKKIHLIVGNHERYGHKTALDFIKEMKHPFWKVYDVPEKAIVGGKPSMIYPFMTPGTLGAQDLPSAQKALQESLITGFTGESYLFHHHVAEGTVWSTTTETSDLNEVYIPKDVCNQYELVIGGHIHKRQRVSDKILVTGNLFTNEIGEHDKAVFILDTDTNEITEHKVPCRGIYKIEMTKAMSIPSEIPDNSIVKIVCVDPAFGHEARSIMANLGATRFDAFIVVEQYPRKRQKLDISDAGKLDLSLENLIKIYSESRKVAHSELQAGLDLLEA